MDKTPGKLGQSTLPTNSKDTVIQATCDTLNDDDKPVKHKIDSDQDSPVKIRRLNEILGANESIQVTPSFSLADIWGNPITMRKVVGRSQIRSNEELKERYREITSVIKETDEAKADNKDDKEADGDVEINK